MSDLPRSCDRTAKANPPRRSLSLAKKLLFSLVTTLAMLAAIEATLSLVGARPTTATEDPFVGFASHLPLFVPETNDQGVVEMVTADDKLSLFNEQRFPRQKAPGTFRIFCMGGSTTYGHPYHDRTSFAGWLREFLPLADDSRRWEVINAGGVSYASYRVASLMEELTAYEPDLFIIYTGHNEFLERRTYRSLIDTPPWLLNLQARLAGTRIHAALRSVLGGQVARPARRIETRELLPAEVEAILDRAQGIEEYHRDDPLAARVLVHFRVSLGRMVDVARRAGAEVIFVTPAANLRDFEPFKSEHREDLAPADRDLWLGYVQQAGDAFQRNDPAAALRSFDSAAAIDARYAQLHFLRGRVLARLGRWEEARNAFLRARDEDVCPLRALTPMRQIVLDVAAERSVPAVDFVGLIDRLAEHGIPGEDWFLDHVHPTIEGHRLLALELVASLDRHGTMQPSAAWTPAAIDAVTHRVIDSLDAREHADALRNLAKVHRWAGKLDAASYLALRAVAGLPGDREAHFLAGDAWYREGELDAAITEYLLALEVDPQYVRPLSRLGSALLDKGQPDAAVNYLERAAAREPARADIHRLLGIAFLRLDRQEDAEAEFTAALLLDPTDAAASAGLGELAARRGDREQAAAMFRRALEDDPSLEAAAEGLQRLAPRFAP